ncbi:RES family NAD+ phosphorylase [Bradyrhizobium japonicum]|uniref:RES family NAD+ phosphorylase n=1 Tax=Bradyrhizobium japonicum TaxID=375 RepID=UPI000462B55E|nr:RES family NAD+ phosphorylase [Bradyrhizobium japonicum]
MAAKDPPATSAKSRLELHTVTAGARFGRIYLGRYRDPLGYGKSPSRFSDPRRRVDANRFGVLYLGDTLKVCFLEAVLRDRHDGSDGSLLLGEDELQERNYAEIEVASALNMVDLRNDCAVRMGVPTDVARASSQALARKWSLAWHEHPSQPDGIIYPSRLNGQTNLAVYHRALPKLRAIGVRRLIRATGLATVLNELLVELASPDPAE